MLKQSPSHYRMRNGENGPWIRTYVSCKLGSNSESNCIMRSVFASVESFIKEEWGKSVKLLRMPLFRAFPKTAEGISDFALWDLSPGYQARVDSVFTSSVSLPSISKPYTNKCWLESWLPEQWVHACLHLYDWTHIANSICILALTSRGWLNCTLKVVQRKNTPKEWGIITKERFTASLSLWQMTDCSTWLSLWTIYKHYNININRVEPLPLRGLYSLIYLIYCVC